MSFLNLIAMLALSLPMFASGQTEPLTPVEMRVVLHRAGWSGPEAREAWRVACGGGSSRWGESACIPSAQNGPYSGLFQIHPDWAWLCGKTDWHQPTENARCARLIREYGLGLGLDGWHYWEVKPSQFYMGTAIAP